MRRLLAPLAWMLIGASLAGTWVLMASESSELDDGSELTPSQSISIESVARDATAKATVIVTFPTLPLPSQVNGRLTSLAESMPTQTPAGGVVWGSVDGRPRIVAASSSAFSFHRTLARGSRGDDVTYLQTFLADLGFYDGPIDSRFGRGLETALKDFRVSVSAETADKVLRVGDLIFADPSTEFMAAELLVGSDIDPSTSIGALRSREPKLDLRFLPQSSAVVLEGSIIDGEGFTGTVGEVAIEPLVLEGGTVRTALVVGELTRPVAAGEVLQVTVTKNAEVKLWIPLGAVALDESGLPFAVAPSGEHVRLELGQESGGYAEVLGGVEEGTQVQLPNPELLGS